MKPRKKSIPSEDIIAKRLKWLEAAYNEFRRGGAEGYLTNQPPVELLVSGLEKAHPARWEIGLIDVKTAPDVSEGGPSIVFTYDKPEERRELEEADWTSRRFDPPAALIQQFHILFGGRLRLRTSRSHKESEEHPKGVPYHYPLIGIAASKRVEFRALRAILNAPSNKLANAHEEFRDLRRCNLSAPWRTQAQASAQFGSQKNGPYLIRKDALEASLRAFDLRHAGGSRALTREEYRSAMDKAYELLDCHPLQHRTPVK